LTLSGEATISGVLAAMLSPPLAFYDIGAARRRVGQSAARRTSKAMPNTPSARKAARKIARRTEINKGRRSEMRSFVRKVEEAIASGDRGTALAALREAEPVIMRSAQKGVVHSNTASRKVSRLAHRVAKLGS
jgi:small subunit ribosomal protein S20